MQDIGTATDAYERWLGERVALVARDIDKKHEDMADDAFALLRGTFYRWAERWPAAAGDLGAAPVVLAVGDVHVENFGLWRDAEGRLVWGLNDVDEAHPAPYTSDLARLAVSAVLAARKGAPSLDVREIVGVILEGYRKGVESKLRPFVLAEAHSWLREAAMKRLRDPEKYWKKVEKADPIDAAAQPEIAETVRAALPLPHEDVRFVHRQAGLGSLGRPRIAALAHWQGSNVCREAKAMVPSAWLWVAGADQAWEPMYIGQMLREAVRAPDPTLGLVGSWLIRRLAPDNSRLEFKDLSDDRDDARLLKAMGRETANIHAGVARVRRAVAEHLASLKDKHLTDVTERLVEATEEDYRAWK